MSEPDSLNHLDALANALSKLLPAGLPATIDDVERCLLDLRGVIARSAKPDDDLSRVGALNELLVLQISRIPFYRQRDLSSAAKALFGLYRSTHRMDLTRRYHEAADAAEYNSDHFRQKIVRKILIQLATQLHQDSLNYSGRSSPVNEITGDAPSITARHLSTRDVAIHEEHISRLWEYVYGLRAELLAIQRLKQWPENENSFLKLEEARGSTLWYLGRLFVSIKSYVDRYGGKVPKGDTEFNAEGMIRIAGWTAELPPELAYRVRLLAAQEPTKEGFLRAAREAEIFITGVGD